MFAVLFLAPDLFMAGYLHGPKAGARIYNFGHTTLVPVALGTLGYFTSRTLLYVSIIWIAHIGFDRLLGYGLKYESGFKDSHLNRV